MTSAAKDTKMAIDPVPARQGSGKWGPGMKAALGLVCVALLAAGATGLAVGLSRRKDNDSSTRASSTAGSANSGTTSSRGAGLITDTSRANNSTGVSGTPNCPASSTCTSTDGAAAPNGASPADCGSFVDIASSTPELSTLMTVIQAAGLSEHLSNDSMEYTVLAPSNSAFAKLTQSQIYSLTADPASLSNVLNRHVVLVALPAASLANGHQLSTVTGGFLNVTVSGETVSLTTSDGASTAKITAAGIKTCNGYIHIIDTILLPSDLLHDGVLVPNGTVAEAPLPVAAGDLPVALIPHVNGITRGEDGTYSICSGRWAPLEFSGPEPCGIRVRSVGVVNIGTEFGGPNGYFSIDAADGLDDVCFKASLAGMFRQKLCALNNISGGVECLPESDGTHCICLAPLGQPAVVVNNRKWEGNIEFNTFLKDVRSRAGLIDDPTEKAINRGKLEDTLVDMLTVTDCEVLV